LVSLRPSDARHRGDAAPIRAIAVCRLGNPLPDLIACRELSPVLVAKVHLGTDAEAVPVD
jgi:hypothetical protein